MDEPTARNTPATALQRTVLSLIAGFVTAFTLSLIVGIALTLPTMGSQANQHISPLWNLTTNFLLSLVITLPFGFILVPIVSLLFRRTRWYLRLSAYVITAAGVTQYLLPYSPQGDGIPFFAFAALGGLLCFLIEYRLANSTPVLRRFAPTTSSSS